MLDFPPLFNGSTPNLVLLFAGLTLFFCGIYYLVKFYTFITGRAQPPTAQEIENRAPRGWLCLPICLIELTIGSFFLLILTGGIIKATTFRDIKLDSVSALEIKPLEGPYADKPGKMKKITDTALLQQGLLLLSQAEPRERDHEHYSDGYIIHFVGVRSKSGKEFFLAVFRKSSKKAKAAIVIPATGDQGNWGISALGGLGEYSCPAFVEWVTTTIDPLFKEDAGKGHKP